jgi:hypothetical protein
MAQQVLLRHDGDALTLLRDLVANQTITIDQVASWPLLKRLRDEGKLADLLQANSGA